MSDTVKKSAKRYKVRVPAPAHKIIGYPPASKVFTVQMNGETVVFPHGLIVQASTRVKTGSLSRTPPLVNSQVAKDYPHIFIEV